MEENKQSKLKQKKLLAVTAIALGGVIIVFLSSGPKKPAHDLARTIADSKNKIILQDPNHGLKAEDRWLYDAEAKLDDYGNFQKEYAADKGGMESRLAEVEKKYEESLGAQTGLIEAQGQEIQALKSQLNAPKPAPSQVANKQDTFGANQMSGLNGDMNSMALPRNIQTTNLELEKVIVEQGEFFKTSEYVPAGAYAQAVIISGVDASVGAAAQSDPRPVLLRIKGPAVSSIYDGNSQETDLKGCLISSR